jgi:hypothetical protein
LSQENKKVFNLKTFFIPAGTRWLGVQNKTWKNV